MAYQTGTLSGSDTLATVVGILHDFAVDEGWTIDAYAGNTLQMHSDQCFLNLFMNTTATVNDSRGSTGLSSSPDHRLEGRLGPDTTALTVSADYRRVSCNDMTPPYSKYFLYSGAEGDPKYITLVVLKANGRWCHISFGNIDKKGAGYTGGAYLVAPYWHWWFSATSISSSGSDEGSDIRSTQNTFPLGGVQNDRASYNVFIGDLTTGTKVLCGTSTDSYDKLAPLVSAAAGRSISDINSGGAMTLTGIFFLGPVPINGVTPIFEVPLYWMNSSTSRVRLLGTIPGYRYASMINRKEGETISFASDQWDVYPFKRALPWNPEPWATKVVTSGPYGVAIKKNV